VIDKLYAEAFDSDLVQILDKSDRDRLAGKLFLWLSTEARKKPLSDLQERLNTFNSRIIGLCHKMSFSAKDGEVTITPNGEEETLNMLNYGTDWFDGHQNLPHFIVSQCLEEHSS
jgi:hypothetical protein